MLEDGCTAGMFIRGYAKEGSQDFVIDRELGEQNEMSGQKQADAGDGEEQQEHFLESGVAFDQAANFTINGLDLLFELLDELQVRLFGKRSSDHFALNSLEGILVSGVLGDKLLANG